MLNVPARCVLAIALMPLLAGCSMLKKQTNPTATPSHSTPGTSTASTQPDQSFLASTKKVQQDFGQTETDLGQLETQIRPSK